MGQLEWIRLRVAFWKVSSWLRELMMNQQQIFVWIMKRITLSQNHKLTMFRKADITFRSWSIWSYQGSIPVVKHDHNQATGTDQRLFAWQNKTQIFAGPLSKLTAMKMMKQSWQQSFIMNNDMAAYLSWMTIHYTFNHQAMLVSPGNHRAGGLLR